MNYRVLKIARILKRLEKLWTEWTNNSDKIYFHHRIDQYRSIWQAVAREKNAQFTEIDHDIWELSKDGYSFRVLNHTLELDNPVNLVMAGRKPLTHRLLKDAGLAVPDFSEFKLQTLESAYTFFQLHHEGCVIKPSNGTAAGDGVTTHLKSNKEIRKAAILASLYCSDLMIEPQVPGECYRLLVLGGNMVHAACRRGPRVIGDGKSTVETLISESNKRMHAENKQQATIDRDCHFTLGWQNLSLNSVPNDGQSVLIKTVHDKRESLVEIRTVYNSNATDQVCSSIKETAEKAARLIKSDFVGVDLITTDPTKPLEETGGVINELNTTPAMHHHYDCTKEDFPAPALIAFDLLMKRTKLSSMEHQQ